MPCFSSVMRPGCLTPSSPSWLQALKDHGPFSCHKCGFCQHVCYMFSFQDNLHVAKRYYHLCTLCMDDLKKTFKGEAYSDDGFICFCCHWVISVKFKRAHFSTVIWDTYSPTLAPLNLQLIQTKKGQSNFLSPL